MFPKQSAAHHHTFHTRDHQYFIYAPVSLNTMLTFRCQEFDDGTKFVESDMQVSCLDDRYSTVTSTFGTAGLLLFAVAPGALFLWVLWRNRAILKKPPHLRSVEEALIVAPAVVGWVECFARIGKVRNHRLPRPRVAKYQPPTRADQYGVPPQLVPSESVVVRVV